ncbi:MAG: phosphoglycerate dehydrogenase [Ruminococcus sp.]|nr:phosphoglycerate dehydrogenase [Ruminococcus sp.]
MYQIQTYNKISSAGLTRFGNDYTIGDAVQNPDAILVRSAALHELEFPENLKAIARTGAGVNNIPLDRCSEAGICVFNTPGANANAVKELVLTGLLLSSRKIPEALTWAASLQDGETTVAKQVEKGKSQFAGPEIQGKTLGIIGLGAIGALVANTAIALGMQVVGTDPFLSVGAALRLNSAVKVVNTQDDVFAKADYLTIHVPYNPNTKGMINAETLAKCKDGVRILNYARGELVDDDAILAAIDSGKVSYYCTDFPNAKTCNKKGIIATPHLGASTPESEDNCASMAADELMAYLEQGDIRNSVNLPNAQLKTVYTKVCVIHQNIPTMISAMTTVVGDAGANIENMLNASKNDYAYTILDIDGVNDAMIDALRAIDGVLRVRVID